MSSQNAAQETAGQQQLASEPEVPAMLATLTTMTSRRPASQASCTTSTALGLLNGGDEVRSQVIELSLSLPDHLWLREGFTRWVYRAAVNPLPAPELVWGTPKREPALLADVSRQPARR